MVLKGLNLARLSLTKAFTHGSAQSLVAASQSSYAAQNSPFGALANNLSPWQTKSVTHCQLGFGQTVSPPNPLKPLAPPGQVEPLAAFLAAWNKHQKLGGSDCQPGPQPSRPFEWKRSSSASRADVPSRPVFDTANLVIDEEAVIFEDDLINTPEISPLSSFSHNRSYSSDDIDYLKKATDAAPKELEAIANEHARLAESRKSSSQLSNFESCPDSDFDRSSRRAREIKQVTKVTAWDREVELLRFAESGRHAEVPVAFDDLLAAGHTPSALSYNALLVAAISLTRSRRELVSKVMHVYADMLQRRVLPNVFTFSVLLELLSARALDVTRQRAILDEKLRRYRPLCPGQQFFLASDVADYQALSQDESLNIAVDIFDSSAPIALKGFSQPTYHLLISACAQAGKIADMARIYSRMELRRIPPQPSTVVEMINGFASVGDLKSAVETYNAYKSLAIDNDNGDLQLERNDAAVYLALAAAYYRCDRPDGAQRFLDQVFKTTNYPQTVWDLLDAHYILPQLIKTATPEVCFDRVNNYSTSDVRSFAMPLIAAAAADSDCERIAIRAYKESKDKHAAHVLCALCAMYLRAGNLLAANRYLARLDPTSFSVSTLSLAGLYVSVSISLGQLELGLQTARTIFSRVRNSSGAQQSLATIIDGAIESIDRSVKQSGCRVSPIASLEIMKMLTDNDGLLPSVAQYALSVFGPNNLPALAPFDLQLVAQVQSGLILSSKSDLTPEDHTRLQFLINLFMSGGVTVDNRSGMLVLQALRQSQNWELAQLWERYYRFLFQD